MIRVLLLLILAFILSPLPKPQAAVGEKLFRAYVPYTANTRYIGAQDESSGVWREKYAPTQIVKISLRWDLIEPDPGEYKWNAEGKDAALKGLARDYRLLISTRAAPRWARKYVEWRCSQPDPGYYDEYARWMNAVVERYEPWAIEVWNEPDALKEDVAKDFYFYGCWDRGDAYAALTRDVYKLVKADHPEVVVMAGALMLPDGVGSWQRSFLRSAPGGDVISYHAYAAFGVAGSWDIIGEMAEGIWEYTSKPLFVTETALLDYSLKCSNLHREHKKLYLDYINRMMPVWGPFGYIRYTIGGNNWRCSDVWPGEEWELYQSLTGN